MHDDSSVFTANNFYYRKVTYTDNGGMLYVETSDGSMD